mgnify:CR=1 FL=1
MDSLSFKIVGILKAGNDTWSSDVDVPYSTLRTIYNMGEEVNQITFTFHGLPTEEENEMFETQIKTVLNNAHHAAPDDDGTIWIWNRFTQHLQMETGAGILRTALWVIGLLTLLSGITGVSNIMLITVKERTHEFGIRKAIGASRGTILTQFLMEAVVLCMMGCALGIFLSWAILQLVSAVVSSLSLRFVLDGTVVAVAVAFCFVIGVIFGLYPANKAAKMNPIDALRYE